MEQLLSTIHYTLQTDDFVSVSEDQKILLENSGNRCSNWSTVYLCKHLNTAQLAQTLRCIHNCVFKGIIYIYCFGDDILTYNEIPMTSGLYNSILSGTCVIQRNSLIFYSLCHDCFIGEYAVIMNCSQVIGKASCSYGNNNKINVGPENSGREIFIAIGRMFHEICLDALNPKASLKVPVCPTIIGDLTIILDYALLYKCDLVVGTFIGQRCKAIMSTLEYCTLWFDEEQSSHVTRSSLTRCLLDAGCSAVGSFAEDTLLLDQASLGERARVISCVLGPDSSAAGGECLHSILGPFVGFHHQSLLIASIWPMGRGNLGYGAMIGANHTGRLNDQECLPGEGCFFGLGSSVKFPFNALDSPYSIIAPATVCLPQRIAFPFSLISSQATHIIGAPSSLCAIAPGWVLRYNPYFIDRSFSKFSQRKKARRHNTDYAILRPSTVDLMQYAKERLSIITGKSFYLESDISGLGKCVLTEKDRLRAIDMYSFYSKRYALLGYLEVLELREDGNVVLETAPSRLPRSSLEILGADLALFDKSVSDSSRSVRTHQLQIACAEFPELHLYGRSVSSWPTDSLLSTLLLLEQTHCAGVETCRQRDERGQLIIEDYLDVHMSVASDGIVRAAIQTRDDLLRRIQAASSAGRRTEMRDPYL
jgi:hypothetical protein